MKKARRTWKRRIPLVVAAFDGFGWRGYGLRRKGSHWECAETMADPVRNGKMLPKAVLDFASKVKAKHLRVLLAGDVQLLPLELPEDLTVEEMHSAIAHEAEAELGLDSRTQRFAAARADLFDMGGGHDALAVSAADRPLLERFDHDADHAGVTLDGVGALEHALLFRHARHDPNRRLLVVRGMTAFYAVPAGDVQPFLLATLPLGTLAANDPTAKERAERARERLAAHDALPLSVVVCGEDAPKVRDTLRPLIGDPAEVSFESLDDIGPEAVLAAAESRAGGVSSGCALVGLPPAPRDPHRHGTVIMMLILLLTLAYAGQRYQTLQTAKEQAQARLAEWESLEQARQRAANETSALLERQQALRARRALLERRDPLPPALMPALEALARHMPRYSRLVSVTAREAEGIEIVGLTHWQDGLPQLDEALRQAAADAGFVREFAGMETEEGRRAQRFRFRIRQGEGQP